MAQTREELATAIFDITHQCLDSFNQIVAKQDESLLTRPFVPGDGTDSSRNRSHSSRDFLGLRNSFSFWIDFTGALSLMDSSLDTRLRGLTDISSMVIELLEMILRNLQRLDRQVGGPLIGSSDPTTLDSKELQATISRWENASRAIDSVLDRLHFLAAAIRKASAKRLEYNVATFLTDDDILFRRDAASLVRWRFPSARKGLSQQLGDSIAVRRRMLLQKHSHAKKLAVRRIVEKTLPVRQSEDTGPHPRPTASPPTKEKIVHHVNVPESGITKASRPDPQAPVLKHLHLHKRPALTSVISTISIAPGDSFEYPQPPKIKENETRIQCPYCLMPLDLGKPKSREIKDWRRHVDEDLRPYVCLFPECAEALMFFTHRHEWESHMESVHSRDWLRRVHTIVWYCDIDHNPPEQFETELQWRKHMKNLDSHPKRQLVEPTNAQLDALSPRKQQVALREQFVCPLCEQIPEIIRPLTEKENENPKMYQFLVDHVANHIKSLSLLSLPCLDTTPVPLDTDGESIAIKDSFRRLMNPGSIPQQPSGIEHLDTASLPPEVWSTLDRKDIATSNTPVPESAWDKEYPEYVHPDDLPESLDDEWVEAWEIWKEESDPLAQESIDFDPVISHLRNSKISVNDAQETAVTTALEDADVNSEDIHGRTQLSRAAKRDQEAVIKLLLEKGGDINSKDTHGQTRRYRGRLGKAMRLWLGCCLRTVPMSSQRMGMVRRRYCVRLRTAMRLLLSYCSRTVPMSSLKIELVGRRYRERLGKAMRLLLSYCSRKMP
ncbi:hypothetical protein HD806DRAFT_122479 [Xylariaceae sp. AK1471]|nr:hypothetical protein HD806DRAFT_122479 [Xylariaceae sp. AK1471]